jgi:hypothetical protein
MCGPEPTLILELPEPPAARDAHLANFGVFGTPERNLVFDVIDFDETLPGPWEWDVKRLVASVVLAARNLRIDEGQAPRSSAPPSAPTAGGCASWPGWDRSTCGTTASTSPRSWPSPGRSEHLT